MKWPSCIPPPNRWIVHAALLAPEPIPLFLFSEGAETLAEPLASQLMEDGLDEAVAALRAFALVDRETIFDERDPTITTETIPSAPGWCGQWRRDGSKMTLPGRRGTL